MSAKEIENKLQERQELRRMAEELEAEIAQLEEEIKREMGEREELTAGPWRVTWKWISGSRLDSKALKAQMPEVAQQFTVKTETRRFCVC